MCTSKIKTSCLLSLLCVCLQLQSPLLFPLRSLQPHHSHPPHHIPYNTCVSECDCCGTNVRKRRSASEEGTTPKHTRKHRQTRSIRRRSFSFSRLSSFVFCFSSCSSFVSPHHTTSHHTPHSIPLNIQHSHTFSHQPTTNHFNPQWFCFFLNLFHACASLFRHGVHSRIRVMPTSSSTTSLSML